MDEQLKVPTLLVGLGGIGSKVVDEIYDMIPEQMRDVIAVHAFDTNINDISKLKHIKNNVTQTSTDWTVKNYLDMADESVSYWFPSEVRELLRKPLTDGAGQVRCVSRLAYRSAIEEGKLSDLQTQIRDIFVARGLRNTSSVRVMIVSSLVGGTGAGIFLQAAMYLREILEREFNKNAIIVRGAFLLADPLVMTKTLDESQWENVMTNCYACMKELNAITVNASSAGLNSNRNVNIELEYRPKQVDNEGKETHIITSRNLPYDFSFLYDSENIKGENLRNFDNYLSQMTRTIYLQLFSPIASHSFSEEDNFMIRLIKEKGLNRYCGAGASSLIYPYEDIIKYCAIRRAYESISVEWLQVDWDYNDEIKLYEQDRQAGVKRERPAIHQRYVDILNRLTHGNNPDPFYNAIIHSTQLRNDQDQEIGNKADLFVQSVLEFIEDIAKKNETLESLKEICSVKHTVFKKPQTASKAVRKNEENLQHYQNEVFGTVRTDLSFIISNVTKRGCSRPSVEDYELNTWMLSRPAPLHPVAVRFLLYSIRNILTPMVQDLQEKNKNLEAKINSYPIAYSLDETNIIEDATDRIRIASKQGAIGKFFGNKLKEFGETYIDQSNRQAQRLSVFRIQKLKEGVLTELLATIIELSESWENFFLKLNDVHADLQEKMFSYRDKHDENSDPTIVYVLANREYKENMWEDIQTALANNELSPDMCKNLYKERYAEFCADYFHLGTSTTHSAKSLGEELVSWNTKVLKSSDKLRYTVVKALKEEARRKNIENVDDHIRSQIRRISELARPYTPTNSTTQLQDQSYWGINNECAKELDTDKMQNVFGAQSRLVKDSHFPETEILRYSARYGYKVEDFAKFESKGPGGKYYTAYQKRVSLLEHGDETITPHLDKRWHKPAFLQDLNQDIVKQDKQKIFQTFFYGLGYQMFYHSTPYGRKIWEIRQKDRGVLTVFTGDTPASATYYGLLEALHHNPSIVEAVLKQGHQMWDDELKSKNVSSFHDHALLQTLAIDKFRQDNIIDILYDFFTENDEHAEKLSQEAFKELLNMVKELSISSTRDDQGAIQAELSALKLFHKNCKRRENEQTFRNFINPFTSRIAELEKDLDKQDMGNIDGINIDGKTP
ncbi:MAG: tubulin-like doman-containing protein [Desulfovibrio sp.]